MRRHWKSTQRLQLVAILLLVLLAFSQPSPAQQSTPSIDKPGSTRSGAGENLSSLSLVDSGLHAENPVVGEKSEFAQFTRELIQVKWRRGDPIDLYVIRPKGIAKPPVILYLYSYPSETDRFRDNDYCARVTHGGLAAVGFVSALTGHRYANRPMKEWFVSELQESLVSSVHDVQMVLNFLSTRDDLDMGKAGMFGAGSGGTIAILAASVDPRIQAIDVLNPWGDWPDWLATSSLIPENERPSYLKSEFLEKVAMLDPAQRLPQLRSQHVRIQNLADDPVTPQLVQTKIEAAAPPAAKIVHYANTRQLFAASSGGRLFQWIKDQFQPVPQAQPRAENVHARPVTPRSAEPGHDD